MRREVFLEKHLSCATVLSVAGFLAIFRLFLVIPGYSGKSRGRAGPEPCPYGAGP